MSKANRKAFTDHGRTVERAKFWRRVEVREEDRRPKMDKIELLARMWMECDPNRGGTDADEIQPEFLESGGSDVETVRYPNPQAGKPRWNWFVPRAEASLEYFEKHGMELRQK